MKLLRNIVANVVICGILLWICTYFELGIVITIQDVSLNTLPMDTAVLLQLVTSFLCLGFVFWLLNSPIKRIIKTLSFPVNMLTLGLFSLVINVVIFYLFSWIVSFYFAPDIAVQLGNILQTLILSLVMSLGITVLKKIV